MVQECNESPTKPDSMATLLSTDFFRALSDPNRVSLLAKLSTCCGPRTVSELAECCPTDLSVVSRHLAVLRDAEILTAEKRGRQVFYRVRYGEMVRSLRALADVIESCCPEDLEADTNDVEEQV